MKCNHEFEKYGDPTGFNFCLARRSGECNPASHGAVTVKARCRICGEERTLNSNNGHYEVLNQEPLELRQAINTKKTTLNQNNRVVFP